MPCHAAPATCTPRNKQMWFSKPNKDKRKTKWNYPGFEFKPKNWPLDFSISPLMSPLTIKAQSLKFESKIPWSTARRPKKLRKAQEGHLEDGKPQKPANGMKSDRAK
jgi:hypothetical protein